MIVMREENREREGGVEEEEGVGEWRNVKGELEIVGKFGGLNVLECWVEGIEKMNGEGKGGGKILVWEGEGGGEGKEVEKGVEMWVDMLKGKKWMSEMVEVWEKKCGGVWGVVWEKEVKGVEEVRELEKW